MMKGKVYLGLVHSPVLNQNNQEITTSVTNLDIHDIARVAATYNLAGFFLIQPLPKQHKLIKELLEYWKKGAGANYNSYRKEAILKVDILNTIEEGYKKIFEKEGSPPKIVATGATKNNDSVSFAFLREKIRNGGVYFLLFGTGWGLSKKIFEKADYILEPIYGIGDYNHLSVRSAASIIVDRICCECWW